MYFFYAWLIRTHANVRIILLIWCLSFRGVSMYQCDERQLFIMESINLMENSYNRHHEIADTITNFLKMLVSLYNIM